MNSNGVKAFAEASGLKFDKKREIAYGIYQGYYTIIHFIKAQKQNIIVMQVNGERLGAESELVNGLNTITTSREFVNYANYIKDTITVNTKSKGNADNNQLKDVMDAVVGLCREKGLVSCCGKCGKEEGLSVYSINKKSEVLCAGCFSSLTNELQSQGNNEKQSNMLAGLVGAFLGSLIGVALWIVIYQLGYISGLVGFVLTICTIKGYEKFSGKLTKVGLFISVIISLVMIFVAEYLSLGILAYIEFSKIYSSIDIFSGIRAVPVLLEESEIFMEFIKDLAFGYVFCILGDFTLIRQTMRSLSSEVEAVRLDD